MKNLNYYVEEYKEQLDKGDIREAYVALVKYVTRVATSLSNSHSDSFSFGKIFHGYMDFTYFYYTNEFLKKRKLKMGFVLNHEKMQFEIWLLGQTTPIQERYWQYFKTTKWNKGRITKPKYSILEAVIVDKPNFNNLDKLTKQIEHRLIQISEEIIEDIKNIN
ncbi:MAG TPA: hypothetical protein PLO56_15670 [Rhodothermales bacterium]|nr:hypothetical protein [Rhodothermales bacterium]